MNNYYNHDDPFAAGTVIRSDAANSKFDGVETGFEAVEIDTNRAITLPVGENVEITETGLGRANKVLGFDAAGNPELQAGVGVNRGNYATATSYKVRDIFKDAAGVLGLNNWYMVHTEFVSTNLTADAGNIIELINVADVETAKAAAQAAQAASEAARDASQTAQGLSQTAQAASEAARDASQTAQGLSEAARDASQTAQGLSEAARDASQTAQGLSEAARNASQAAQAAAELALDNFTDLYLGAKASAPTLDNDGDPLQDGALYWNTTSKRLYVYDLNTTSWNDANNISKASTAQATAATDDSTYMTPAKTFDQFNSLPRKNYIANGNFDFWGRGSSFTFTSAGFAGGYIADGWLAATVGGSMTVTKTLHSLSLGEVPTPSKYLARLTQTSAATSARAILEHRIKGVRSLAGKTVTVSIWARVLAGTKSFDLDFIQDFGTGGSPSADVQTGIGTLNLDTNRQKFSFTVTVPTIDTKTIGDNEDDYLSFRIVEGSGFDTFDFDVFAVQIEEGEIATDFEYRAPTFERLLTGEPNPYDAVTGQYDGYAALKAGRKNYIINGNFDVWQRGTSLVDTNGYIADRWYGYGNTATTKRATVSRQAFAPGQVEVPNEPVYYFRYDCTTGTSSTSEVMQQRTEDVRSGAGKILKISWYAKCSVARTFAYNPSHVFGGGGSPSGPAGMVVEGVYFDVTTSWQRFEKTLVVNSISGKTIGTNSAAYLFRITDGNTDSATYTLDIAQVQIEEGSVATNFEHRSYGEELLLCQRYYCEQARGSFMSGDVTNTSSYTAYAHFPVTMRAAPTVTLTNAIAIGFPLTPGSAANISVDGFTENRDASSTRNGQFASDYTADAEL